MSKENSFVNAVKSHYSQKTLSIEQLAELGALQKRFAADKPTLENEPSNPQMLDDVGIDTLDSLQSNLKDNNVIYALFRNTLMLKTVAAIFVAIVTLQIFLGTTHNTDIPSVFPRNIMEEIAHNHLKNSKVQVSSNSIQQVDDYLAALDFSLIESQQLDDEWRLVGGRYCMIGGFLAAQLKVENKYNGEIATFYQTSVSQVLPDGNQSIEVMVGDVKVRIWNESGRLMGLAQS